MRKLLKINNVEIPDTEGEFAIDKSDKYNEYEAEDGSVIVEPIRQGVLSLSVSYNGLFEPDLLAIVGAIRLVSTVELYNPMTGTAETITAKITGVQTSKRVYKYGISVWSLSFQIDQL